MVIPFFVFAMSKEKYVQIIICEDSSHLTETLLSSLEIVHVETEALKT